MVVAVMGAFAAQSLLTAEVEGMSTLGAMVIALYSVGAHGKRRDAVLGLLVGLAAIPALSADAADYPFDVVVMVAPWLAGRVIRGGRLRAAELERLTLELEREREEKARLAVAAERSRIARELHDVVAHSISVMVVQAGAVRSRLDSEHERLREALSSVERTGRQALAEMRRLLGVLRTETDQPLLAPPPSLAELDGLLQDVREAGLPVELRIEGKPRPLAPGVDLSAYRIVQEALTNTIKHAGEARAWIIVRYGRSDLELVVEDDGGGPSGRDGGGHGLLGMRERVALFGGELEAGARNGGGFIVRARLPLEPGEP
jgi:signal transduction histidine kinase